MLISKSVGSIHEDVDDLVSSLGYLDLREYVALNKYLLEAANHKQVINQAKAKFLSIAMKRLTAQKEKEVNTQFAIIDEQAGVQSDAKLNQKVNQLIKLGPEMQEMFYKAYYRFKNYNSNKNNQLKDDYEKYQIAEQALKEQENDSTSKQI